MALYNLIEQQKIISISTNRIEYKTVTVIKNNEMPTMAIINTGFGG